MMAKIAKDVFGTVEDIFIEIAWVKGTIAQKPYLLP